MNIDTNVYPITTCGIYITRRCNLSCEHCSTRKLALNYHELTLKDWQKAFLILQSLGINKVSILGGEPTTYPGIVELVQFNREVTGLDLAIVSNSMSDLEIYAGLARAGLQRFSTSMDVLGPNGFDSCSTAKSLRAHEVLALMQQLGVPQLTAYSVLRPENMEQIELILKQLTAQGISLYILPYHASPGDHWQTRGRNLPPAFTESDKGRLQEFVGKMIAAKRDGALLSNTVEYLTILPDYAINLNWHCAPVISELRIDADGVLMSCNDIKGEHLSQYSIFSLEDSSNFSKVLEARAKDTEHCSGCFWPSHYHAQQLRYQQTGESWIWR